MTLRDTLYDHATPARVGGAAGLLAALVVLWPWMSPGALLVRDLVAVADPAWSTGMLLESARLPRDIPGEVVAALLGQVVPGDLVVRVVLLGALAALGAGAGRLAGSNGSRAAAMVAGAAAVWNPWVWARLHQGQWLVVVALAAVPWVVVHLRADHRWRLARVMVVAGLTGFAAMVVVVPTLVVVGVVARRWIATAIGLAVAAVMALPWFVVSGDLAVDPDGFAAFAPSADLPTGVATSLLTGGGYFNTAIAPDARASLGIALVAIAVALAAVVGAGLWREEPRLLHDWRTRTGFLVVAVLALGFTLLSATSGGQDLLVDWSRQLSWLALARDSHRLLAPWVVLLAVGMGHLAKAAARRWSGAFGFALVGVALVVLVLPDPLVGQRLPTPSELPPSWQEAARQVNADRDPGRVLVVPHGQTQSYRFTEGRPVAVPLRRLVAREVLLDTRLVVDDDDRRLVVDDVVGDGEVREVAARDPARVSGAELARLGVTWVAITDPERFVDTPGPQVQVALRAPTIQLLQLAPTAPAPRLPARSRWPLVLDLLVATVAAALIVAGGPVRTGRTHPQD